VKPWRDVVRQVCEARAEAESRRQWGLPPEVPPPYNYRLEHVRAVVTLARCLALELGADEEVVEAAAWLHDIAKSAEDEGNGHHGQQAAQEVPSILADTDFPPQKVSAVCDAVIKHVGLVREPGTTPVEPLEAAILWDADKLSKLGFTAALHFARASLTYWEAHTTDEAIRQNLDWLPMNEAIVASLNTPLAREMGVARAAHFELFWEHLAREWTGLE
jgi:uncharacterized protein